MRLEPRDRRDRVVDRMWTHLARPAGRIARLTAPRRRHDDDARRVVVIRPAALGSLGDEAMETVVVTELRRRGFDPLVTGLTGGAASGELDLSAASGRCPLRAWFRLVRSRPRATIVLGADVMNGYYSDRRSARRWNLASAARAGGIPTAVVGFSWNVPTGCGPESVAAARRCHPDVHVSCRDRISAERFDATVERSPVVGMDVAFLLEEDPSADAAAAAKQLTDELRAQGLRPVVVNLNSTVLGSVASNPDLVRSFAQELVELEADGVATLLVPHDMRGDDSDAAWATATCAAARESGAKFTVALRPETARSAKAIMRTADAVVSGRMHLGIAAIGVGCPTRIVSYQGKVAGLSEMLGVGRIDLDLSAPELAGTLGAIVRDLVGAASGERPVLAERLTVCRDQASSLLDSMLRHVRVAA